MPEKKKPHPAEQFDDSEMEQVKRYGQALGGAPTDFDEQVENALNERQRAREASAKKMHAAQTSGSEGLGPTEAEQALVKQRSALQQQAAGAGAQSAAQAQGGQPPGPTPPPAPSGPQGSTTPYSSQAGAVGGAGEVGGGAAAQAGPPPAPGGGEQQPPPEEAA
jgi:hypothetical protein